MRDHFISYGTVHIELGTITVRQATQVSASSGNISCKDGSIKNGSKSIDSNDPSSSNIDFRRASPYEISFFSGGIRTELSGDHDEGKLNFGPLRDIVISQVDGISVIHCDSHFCIIVFISDLINDE